MNTIIISVDSRLAERVRTAIGAEQWWQLGAPSGPPCARGRRKAAARKKGGRKFAQLAKEREGEERATK